MMMMMMMMMMIAHISNDFIIEDRNIGQCDLLYLKSFQSTNLKNETHSIHGVSLTRNSSVFSKVAKYGSARISDLVRHQRCFYNNLLTPHF